MVDLGRGGASYERGTPVLPLEYIPCQLCARLLHAGGEDGRHEAGRDSERARSNRPLVLRQQAAVEVVVGGERRRCKAVGLCYRLGGENLSELSAASGLNRY